MYLKRILVLLLTFSMLFSVIGCSTIVDISGIRNIEFDTVARGGGNTHLDIYEGDSSRIQIMTSGQSPFPEGMGWISSSDKDKVVSVDFAKHFAIMAFQGKRGHSAAGIEITRILQKGNTIYVLAFIREEIERIPSPQMVSSPYHIVRVNKDQINPRGSLTIILLKEVGEEKDKITFPIP